MMDKPKPKVFTSEAEERAFWESNDSEGRVDWSKATRVRVPNLNHHLRQSLCAFPTAFLSASRSLPTSAMCPISG
jgi:L-ribulose-5-phosphate 3-epimerase UlaE